MRNVLCSNACTLYTIKEWYRKVIYPLFCIVRFPWLFQLLRCGMYALFRMLGFIQGMCSTPFHPCLRVVLMGNILALMCITSLVSDLVCLSIVQLSTITFGPCRNYFHFYFILYLDMPSLVELCFTHTNYNTKHTNIRNLHRRQV